MSISPISRQNSSISFKAHLEIDGDTKDLPEAYARKLSARAKSIGGAEDKIFINLGKLEVKKFDTPGLKGHTDTFVGRNVRLKAEFGKESFCNEKKFVSSIFSGEHIVNPFLTVNEVLKGLHEHHSTSVLSAEEAMNSMRENRDTAIRKLAKFLFSGDGPIPLEVKKYYEDANGICVGIERKALSAGKSAFDAYQYGMSDYHFSLVDSAKNLTEDRYLAALSRRNGLRDYDRNLAKLEKYLNDTYLFAGDCHSRYNAQKVLAGLKK